MDDHVMMYDNALDRFVPTTAAIVGDKEAGQQQILAYASARRGRLIAIRYQHVRVQCFVDEHDLEGDGDVVARWCDKNKEKIFNLLRDRAQGTTPND